MFTLINTNKFDVPEISQWSAVVLYIKVPFFPLLNQQAAELIQFHPRGSTSEKRSVQKPTFPNSNSIWTQWKKSHLVDPLLIPIYLFIYLFIYFTYFFFTILKTTQRRI